VGVQIGLVRGGHITLVARIRERAVVIVVVAAVVVIRDAIDWTHYLQHVQLLFESLHWVM
jgi:hypothetical protein